MSDSGPVRSPTALTIAGSDSSGGAGVQADLKTFTALGVYGASVVTALTAQNTTGVAGVHQVPPGFIAAQMAAVTDDLDVRATKTGMLGDIATVAAVAAAIRRHALAPVVVDPVMVATSGDPLVAPDAVQAIKAALLPLAALVTPNLDEAARLAGGVRAGSLAEAEQQGRVILALGPAAVLVKGGHGAGPEAVDLLVTHGAPARAFAAPRVATTNTHGTGCTLSAAIAAFLAQGLGLEDAVAKAKRFVFEAIASGRALSVGRGNGPVDHLFAIRGHVTAV